MVSSQRFCKNYQLWLLTPTNSRGLHLGHLFSIIKQSVFVHCWLSQLGLLNLSLDLSIAVKSVWLSHS